MERPNRRRPARSPRNRTLIVAAIAGAIVLAAGIAVFSAISGAGRDSKGSEPAATTLASADSSGSVAGNATVVGYATPEDAVNAELASGDMAGWVVEVFDEIEDRVTYWAGPPNSEFVTQIVVERNVDGSWSVAGVEPIEMGGEELLPIDEAVGVVYEFLYAVQEDRATDARALTTNPFRSQAASAATSQGELMYFEAGEVAERSDGSFVVQTEQQWGDTIKKWQYVVVSTSDGYRISKREAY